MTWGRATAGVPSTLRGPPCPAEGVRTKFCATAAARAVQVHQTQARGSHTGKRPEAPSSGRRGLARAAQEQQGWARCIEDQNVGLAVAVDVEHPQRRRRVENPLQYDLVRRAPAERKKRPRVVAAKGAEGVDVGPARLRAGRVDDLSDLAISRSHMSMATDHR